MEYEEYIKNRMIKLLILMRGLPGAGKSTLSEALTDKENICTADDFFMDKGEYKFDATKLGAAHDYCQTKCRLRMAVGAPLIIVANTLTSEREMKPYEDLARQFGYMVHSVIVENRHGGVNTHNVPEESLEKMRNRLINNINL
jgi:predicted kinase